MTKVVSYLFDNMFKSKHKISFAEKALVIGITAIIVTTAALFVL